MTGAQLQTTMKMNIILQKENGKMYVVYKVSGLFSSEMKGEIQINGSNTWEEFQAGTKTQFTFTDQGINDMNDQLAKSIKKQYGRYAEIDINFTKRGHTNIEADSQKIEINFEDQEFVTTVLK